MTGELPATMTCIEVSEPGGPDVLRPVIRPLPTPAAGEVLIKVAAAGINGPDLYQRKGAYPPPPGTTDIPGLEVAGVIVALAAGVDGWLEGDLCCALTAGGGYAEYCTAPAAQCLPIPDGLSLVEAAALPETYFTVWTNIFERARLKPGETLLVHGGAGGIGTTAIQLAAAFEARVLTTAAGPEHCARLTELGAARAIDYLSEDFVAVIKEVTGGKGVDVILDIVGGDYVARNIACLARDGRLVNIAFNKGAKVELDLMPVMLKRLTLTGSTLRIQPVARKAEIAAALKEKVWPLLASGRVRPLIFRELPLAQAAEGHRLMEGAQHIGKIMLVT
ncbi:MAG: NAD(P)H-quinone oxidoreductase [Rhodospirillales bacterium]|jgi:putative PIG3 family NAD(P)H quinone oxidoreductase|nr:NAD(P)H-quinone oxidoreductase [Rhodospirillales bacterium]